MGPKAHSSPFTFLHFILQSNSILWCRLLQRRFCKSNVHVGLIDDTLFVTLRHRLSNRNCRRRTK